MSKTDKPERKPPTDEQVAFLDLARTTSDNIMINAYAGTGKTDTIERAEEVVKQKPILYLVFNARNAKEAEGKMSSTTTVRTFNSMGHRIWAKCCSGNITLNKTKTQDILRAIIKDEIPDRETQQVIWSIFWQVIEGVGLAKNLGYVPEGKFPTARPIATQAMVASAMEEDPDDLTLDMIDTVLTRSIKAALAGSVDFNDQVYMPAIFPTVAVPQFPLTMVDERQDLNPVNEVLIRKLVKNRRLFCVGDRFQNIYGFRGAQSDGMDRSQQEFNMSSCKLTISFRCPSEIVKAARWRVKDFQWFKEGGVVRHLHELNSADIIDGSTFLCRNNAPLFALALKLLGAGHSVQVAGSDIGPKLLAIMKKLGSEDMSQAAALAAIDDWEAERLAKNSKSASDLAACMRVFLGYGSTLSQAIAYADHLFKQTGTIQLMTGHKSKGLEFDTVYHLDPWLLDDHEQDKNLHYVIQTRSRDQYFTIDSERIKW